MRLKDDVEPIKGPTGMGRGGSRPKPPKAVAHRASLKATRSMPDHQTAKRRLTDKTIAFAPAAVPTSAYHGAVEELHQMRGTTWLGEQLEEGLEHPRAAEPPKIASRRCSSCRTLPARHAS
jgi:hypothetical protein